MGIVFLSIGLLSLGFLVDISINLRRVDAGIKKIIKDSDKANSSAKV